jgi:hypothetical protein
VPVPGDEALPAVPVAGYGVDFLGCG